MKKKNIFIFIIFIFTNLFLMSCLLTSLFFPSDQKNEINKEEISIEWIKQNSEEKLSKPNQERYEFSLDQKTVIAINGYPTKFQIIFTQTERREVWSYDHLGIKISFLNGLITSEKEYDYSGADNYSTDYTPDLFYSGMHVEDIVFLTEAQEYILGPSDNVIPNTEILFIEGLSIGLKDGKIFIVESIPLK